MRTGRSAPSVTIAGGRRPATAARKSRGSRCRSIPNVIQAFPASSRPGRERSKGLPQGGHPYGTLTTGTGFLTSSRCARVDALGMSHLGLLAANGSGDLVAGLVMGVFVGILL